MKNVIFSLIVAGISSPAFAGAWVTCGETASVENGEIVVNGFELELSSEDYNFSGSVGGTWNMRMGGQNALADWLSPNPDVTASTSQEGSSTVVTIKIINAMGPSGPVGRTYKLIGLYDDQPVLERYTMGGFVGTHKVGTFQCVSGND